MNANEITARIERLKVLRDGFGADYWQWHLAQRPDVLSYALALERAAEQLGWVIEALKKWSASKAGG